MMKTRQAVYKWRICWNTRIGRIDNDPIWETYNDALNAAKIIWEPNREFYLKYWVEKVEVKEAENVNS